MLDSLDLSNLSDSSIIIIIMIIVVASLLGYFKHVMHKLKSLHVYDLLSVFLNKFFYLVFFILIIILLSNHAQKFSDFVESWNKNRAAEIEKEKVSEALELEREIKVNIENRRREEEIRVDNLKMERIRLKEKEEIQRKEEIRLEMEAEKELREQIITESRLKLAVHAAKKDEEEAKRIETERLNEATKNRNIAQQQELAKRHKAQMEARARLAENLANKEKKEAEKKETENRKKLEVEIISTLNGKIEKLNRFSSDFFRSRTPSQRGLLVNSYYREMISAQKIYKENGFNSLPYKNLETKIMSEAMSTHQKMRISKIK